jgi:hypothetical protein
VVAGAGQERRQLVQVTQTGDTVTIPATLSSFPAAQRDDRGRELT